MAPGRSGEFLLMVCGRRKNGLEGRGEEKKPTPNPKKRITTMDSVKKKEERIQVFCIHYSACGVKGVMEIPKKNS